MGVGIAELRESLSGYAAGFDAAVLSAAQAEKVVEEASRIEKIAANLKGLAAARLAEVGTWRAEGERSAAHQLARRTGTSVVQAASVIDTARRLGALPETAAAARRGELSAEQAAAIADAAVADPGAEAELLETARRSPLAELRQQCARTKAAGGVDVEARRRRIHQRRSLRSFTDAEGEWHLHCRNNPEVGARIMAALDPFREAVFRQARSEGRHEPPEAYSADALTEMARQSCAGAVSAESPAAAASEPPALGVDGATPESGPAEAGGTAEAGGNADRRHRRGRCRQQRVRRRRARGLLSRRPGRNCRWSALQGVWGPPARPGRRRVQGHRAGRFGGAAAGLCHRGRGL